MEIGQNNIETSFGFLSRLTLSFLRLEDKLFFKKLSDSFQYLCQNFFFLTLNFTCMHLYALDENGHSIEASIASKQYNYKCMECFGPVRVRSGLIRQPHFFHLERPENCRQHGKSLEHLTIQLHLQQALPPGDAILEMRFPSINRIADVAWLSQKLVFEVQCSPISPLEIQERTFQYAKVGYQVVWIFHDQQFNRNRKSGAEGVCRKPYYYTNMTGEGDGFIYDQMKKKFKGVKYPIDLSKPKRFSSGTLYFQGDITDLQVLEKRKSFMLFNLYFAFLHFFLEKSSK